MGPFTDEHGLLLTPAHKPKDMLIVAWGGGVEEGRRGDVMHKHKKKIYKLVTHFGIREAVQ